MTLHFHASVAVLHRQHVSCYSLADIMNVMLGDGMLATTPC